MEPLAILNVSILNPVGCEEIPYRTLGNVLWVTGNDNFHDHTDTETQTALTIVLYHSRLHKVHVSNLFFFFFFFCQDSTCIIWR